MATHIRQPANPSYRILFTAIFLGLIPANAHSQASAELALGDRLAHDYEKQAGFGHTSQLEGISNYISSVGNRVASALPSRPQYHFIFDPNPAFKSVFALPCPYVIVAGGLLALTQTEDELANALAHEMEHVELAQVSRRVTELTKRKELKKSESQRVFPGLYAVVLTQTV